MFGPGTDDPIVWYEGTGTTDRRFMSSDERGSIVSLTDSSGALIAVNIYDEYGIPGAANVGRFGYTGQAWLGEIGLQYSKARIYSPTLGRFLQTDPIGHAGGINLYAYVRNDPMDGTDPSGLCPNCVTGGVGAVIGGIIGGSAYLIGSNGNATWGGLGAAVGVGALTGGLAGATMGASSIGSLVGMGYAGIGGATLGAIADKHTAKVQKKTH